MRHFYIRAKIKAADNSPWKNKVTFGKNGTARVPIGSVALDFKDDELVFSYSLLSVGDNFKYNTAKNICRGRLVKGDSFYLDPYEFKKSLDEVNTHNIFKLINIHHKYLKWVDPELFVISARACFKKLCLDKGIDYNKYNT
jgi:hypothetical protein